MEEVKISFPFMQILFWFQQPVTIKKTGLFILLISLAPVAISQAAVDGSFSAAAGERAIEEYLKAKGQNLSLYNGIQHIGYSSAIKGSAYYKSDAWQIGSVFYDGILYKEIYLKYDMYKDELIIRHPKTLLAIILFTPRIGYFSFLHSSFINQQKTDSLEIATGFYEQLTEGKISLLVKRKIILEEKITTEMETAFMRRDQYYVWKDGIYHVVKTDKTFLGLLGERKKTIQKYLKANKIKFKNDPEHTLITIAQLYNQAID